MRALAARIPISRPLIYLLLIAYALMVVYPMFWLFATSLKTDREIFLQPFSLPALRNLQWSNFTNAWVKAHFGSYFLNSVLLTFTTVIATVLLSAMAAYALSRFRFAGARPIFFYFLAGLMVPLQLAIVPLFFEMKQFGLLNSRVGLFLVYLATAFPFSIFVLTGFFRSLPGSLHESALLDGCSEFGAFWRIMLPLARPGLITVAIFLFLGNWNEFFLAFICLSGQGSESLRTLPLGLANVTIVSQYRSDWGMAFAGLVLMMLPTFLAYVFLQKHLTRGITAGRSKGDARSLIADRFSPLAIFCQPNYASRTYYRSFMSKYAMPLGSLICLIAIAANAAEKTDFSKADVPDTFKTYTDPAYTIKHPADWTPKKSDDAVQITAADGGTNININSADAAGASLADIVTETKKELAKSLKGMKFITDEPASFGSNDAHYLVYTADFSGVTVQLSQLMVKIGTKVYIFSFGGTPENFKKFDSAAHQMVASFKPAAK